MAKKLIRILAVGLALIMCLAMAVPAFADDENKKYTPNTSGIVYFDKDLVMPRYATVPDVEFKFELKANRNGADLVVSGWKVHPGIFTNTVPDETAGPEETGKTKEVTVLESEYKVEFDATHPTTVGKDGNAITQSSAEKYATESFKIDFTKIVWPEPGIYRYVITEKRGNDTDKGITYNAVDEQTTYYIDVYVQYNDDDQLVIGDVIVTDEDNLTDDKDTDGDGVIDENDEDSDVLPEEGDKIEAGGKDPETPGDEPQEPGEGEKNPEDKLPDDDGDDDDDPETPKDNDGINKGKSKADFKNTYTPLYIELTKTVKGNQGSRIDYFEFEITLTDAPYGVYYITGANAEKNTNPYLTVWEGEEEDGSDNSGTAKVYLKNGDTIKILVPYGTKYKIEEKNGDAKADQYLTSTAAGAASWTEEQWNTTGDEATAYPKSKVAEMATAMAANASVTFVNYKEGAIPTGVLMTIAPFAALMGIGLAGGAVVLKKKKED